MTPNFKTKPIRSEAYLKWVKSLPCCICGAPADDAHHGIAIGFGGAMGSKIDDLATLPACRTHHDEIHRNANQYDQKHYILQTIMRAAREGVIRIG